MVSFVSYVDGLVSDEPLEGGLGSGGGGDAGDVGGLLALADPEGEHVADRLLVVLPQGELGGRDGHGDVDLAVHVVHAVAVLEEEGAGPCAVVFLVDVSDAHAAVVLGEAQLRDPAVLIAGKKKRPF